MKNVLYLAAKAKRYSFSTINCSTTKSGEFVFDSVRVKMTTCPRTSIERDKGSINWFVLCESIPISSSICETYIYIDLIY